MWNFTSRTMRKNRLQSFDFFPLLRLKFHSHPIPIPWLIVFPFPWESHGTDGIPVFPIPMHISSPHFVAIDLPKPATHSRYDGRSVGSHVDSCVSRSVMSARPSSNSNNFCRNYAYLFSCLKPATHKTSWRPFWPVMAGRLTRHDGPSKWAVGRQPRI